MKRFTLAMALFLALGGNPALAVESTPPPKEEEAETQRTEQDESPASLFSASATVGTSFVTQYVNARGFTPHDGPSLQPFASVTLGHTPYGSLSYTMWQSLRLDHGTVTEEDHIVTYSNSAGPVTMNVEWARYIAPGVGVFEEVNTSLSVDVPSHPKVLVAYDYRDGSGVFAELSVSQGIALGGPLSLEGTLAGMYNGGYAVDSHSFAGLKFDISVPIQVTDGLTLRMHGRQFVATHEDFSSDTSVGATLTYTATNDEHKD